MDKKSKFVEFITSKKFTTIIGFVGIYLLITGISLAIFTFIKKGSVSPISTNQGSSGVRVDLSKPKTEVCPINGMKYTKEEKDIWEQRRPITAMIENHADSRPQAGLSKTDVIYEAVAEGGITRFLAVYYCAASAEDVSIRPIRSARFYFVNWAAEYGKNPLFVHQGGANNFCTSCYGGVKPRGDVDPSVDVYKLLDKLGWANGRYGNDMDGQTNLGFPQIQRVEWKADVAWEHRVTGSTDLLFEEGAKRGFGYKNEENIAWDNDFIAWKFIDDKPTTSTKVSDISFEFWSNKPDYDVEWKYDEATNSYKRFNGGKEHVDYNNNEQLSAKNIVVIFVAEKGPVDKELHMSYTVTGTGEALIFQNGEAIKATWSKKSITDRMKFTDEDGKEISFVRGRIWIEAVPKGNEINY
jgi:hypothetical protein